MPGPTIATKAMPTTTPVTTHATLNGSAPSPWSGPVTLFSTSFGTAVRPRRRGEAAAPAGDEEGAGPDRIERRRRAQQRAARHIGRQHQTRDLGDGNETPPGKGRELVRCDQHGDRVGSRSDEAET